jgi:hypothetical protein
MRGDSSRARVVVATALGLLFLPVPALAWGPAAHLDFGLLALEGLVLLAPAAAALLKRHLDDFLYGSLAADITIGKNLSPWHQHCHNWQVGFTVLERAEREDTRAFAWGYLAHLAADGVAHNYYVPVKLVESYPLRGAGHTYWEVRFDTRVRQEAWELARRLSTTGHPDHDRHLRAILRGPLFSFPVQKQIFNGFVLFTRFLRWRRLAEAEAHASRRPLADEQVEEIRGLCVERILDLLLHGREAACLATDPTGLRNLRIALEVRERLRRERRLGHGRDPQGLARRFRPLFRQAMDAKLSLPAMLEILGPEPYPGPVAQGGLLARPRRRSPEELAAERRIRDQRKAVRRAELQALVARRLEESAAVEAARAAYDALRAGQADRRKSSRSQQKAARREARARRRAAARAAREAEARLEREARAAARAAYRAQREAESRLARAGESPATRRRLPRALARARALLRRLRS